MNKYIKQSLAVIVAFFFCGFGYGLWNTKKQNTDMARATPLRILCGDGWISDSLIRQFALENKTPVQLFTYARPNELLRQLANSDGRIDVICTSSLLLRGLIQSKWIRKMDYQSLPNRQLLSVDFANLPYDPKSEYSVPLFWNLYGLFGKGDATEPGSWKDTWASKKVVLWGEDLNLFQLLNTLSPLDIERPQQGDEDIRNFVRDASLILKPSGTSISAEALIAKGEWLQIPLARVARLLGKNSPYRFWLPEDGAALEVGVLTIGERAQQPELAMKLINQMISSDEALETHKRLKGGVVHASLNGLTSIAPLEKAQAVRGFPLTRFKFPDLDLEALPHFQKIVDDTTAGSQRN